jgi:hypothetical protein
MKRSLETRLAELEKVHQQESRARAYSARVADASKFHEWVRRFLKALGTEQGAKESLAEAMARGMGINMSELKARFQEAAAGRSFWTPDELDALRGNRRCSRQAHSCRVMEC